jgi:hypothetical protein
MFFVFLHKRKIWLEHCSVLQIKKRVITNQVHEMKIKTLCILLAAPLIALSMNATAGFVQIDWKEVGDNRASLHEETGIEWLKLNETRGMSINDVKNKVKEGGEFEGWRLPAPVEVFRMFDDFYHVGVKFDINYKSRLTHRFRVTRNGLVSRPAEFVDAFGSITVQLGSGTSLQVLGFLDGDNRVSMTGIRASDGNDGAVDTMAYHSNNNLSFSQDSFNKAIGVYLVADGGATKTTRENPSLTSNNQNSSFNVPEPTVVVLFGMGFAGLMLRKKVKVSK